MFRAPASAANALSIFVLASIFRVMDATNIVFSLLTLPAADGAVQEPVILVEGLHAIRQAPKPNAIIDFIDFIVIVFNKLLSY